MGPTPGRKSARRNSRTRSPLGSAALGVVAAFPRGPLDDEACPADNWAVERVWGAMQTTPGIGLSSRGSSGCRGRRVAAATTKPMFQLPRGKATCLQLLNRSKGTNVFAATFLAIAVLGAQPANDSGPRLSGAFIQFDNNTFGWTPQQWAAMLDRMRATHCDIVIVQYLEKRDGDEPPTSESYIPSKPGDAGPLGAILTYADAHPGMAVYVGLRYDNRLLSWEYINRPGVLRAALKDELARNRRLARDLALRLSH